MILTTENFDLPSVTQALPFGKRKASTYKRLKLAAKVWQADVENKLTRKDMAKFFGYGSPQSMASSALNIIGFSFASKTYIENGQSTAYKDPGDYNSDKWNAILCRRLVA